jgi:pimeloyl-ACP methyl ester carboxylesterase
MAKWLLRAARAALIAVAAALFLWGATGLAMAASGWSNPPRGTLLEVDGRKQRLVCEGQARPGVPTVVFEAGAYSGAADWGVIQPLVAAGGRACAYDRAGIGWSEPSKAPRDPGTLARELDALLVTAGETGPYVLVGHSMAGLLLRAYLSQFPDKVAGLVFVDAADPSAIAIPEARVWIARYQRMARLAAQASSFGLVKPLAPFLANRIGLTGVALQEKRRMFGAASHMRASAAEIGATIDGADAALAADPFIPALPVAAITAGPTGAAGRSAWKEAQQRAARMSTRGSVVNVDAATHTSILGPVHGAVVVDAIERVRRDAAGDIAAGVARPAGAEKTAGR